VTELEVAMVTLDVGRVVEIVQRLFGVTEGREGAREKEPARIGLQEHGAATAARDAYFTARPAEEATASWLALRERAARPSVVFVPTLRRLASDLIARHGAADRVEIVALEDALGIEAGELARAKVANLRVVREPLVEVVTAMPDEPSRRSLRDVVAARPRRAPRAEHLRKTRDLELPPVKTWRDLQICLLDGETVRLDGAGMYMRCSYQDLGFASTKSRKPLREWDVLVRTCVGEGLFDWKAFDTRWDVVRKYVSNVGKMLQGVFGIDEPPYEEPGSGVYRSKFRAREGVPVPVGGG
jgi:hypothetical protein